MSYEDNGNSMTLEGRDLECIRDDRVLFSGLDFVLGSGQTLLLEGRNGSGKTSLLRILCGIRLPESGAVTWCGEDIFGLGPLYHEHVAYVGHRDGLKLDLTPMENLAMARGLGNPNPDTSPGDALHRVDLLGFEDIPTRNLSAGQQRRLALARLLVTRSQVWILDEPFTSLDVHGIELVEELFHEHVSLGGMLAMTSHHAVNLGSAHVHRINLSA
jgi:heme exporter protein A